MACKNHCKIHLRLKHLYIITAVHYVNILLKAVPFSNKWIFFIFRHKETTLIHLINSWAQRQAKSNGRGYLVVFLFGNFFLLYMHTSLHRNINAQTNHPLYNFNKRVKNNNEIWSCMEINEIHLLLSDLEFGVRRFQKIYIYIYRRALRSTDI